MKKFSIISCFLIIFSIFTIGCTNLNNKDEIIVLNVISYSDKNIVATGNNNEKYEISNSELTITDNKDNSLSWDKLKDANVIEVHYSGEIKEVSPALFEEITKIVIIS